MIPSCGCTIVFTIKCMACSLISQHIWFEVKFTTANFLECQYFGDKTSHLKNPWNRRTSYHSHQLWINWRRVAVSDQQRPHAVGLQSWRRCALQQFLPQGGQAHWDPPQRCLGHGPRRHCARVRHGRPITWTLISILHQFNRKIWELTVRGYQ